MLSVQRACAVSKVDTGAIGTPRCAYIDILSAAVDFIFFSMCVQKNGTLSTAADRTNHRSHCRYSSAGNLE